MKSNSLRERFKLSNADIEVLKSIAASRTEPAARVRRANILLAYHNHLPVKHIAKKFDITRPSVYTCIKKAIKGGVELALTELHRSGRPAKIQKADKLWVVHIACSKPKEFEYAQELWTFNLLAKHVRNQCESAGHPALKNATKSMIHDILNEFEIKPHKVSYYLERKDPEFEEKMARVLCVYKDVHLFHEREGKNHGDSQWVVLSYDEKPGIQAIENISPELPPVSGKYSSHGRDYEYRRHGTVSLLAGIDLLTGKVHGLVRDRHRSVEFIEFLQLLNKEYPPEIKIRIILDNHSSHISKQTMAWLEEHPNRFEFTFTPKHGSWLNIIESFFSKMSRVFLRSIRVQSKEELKERLKKYLEEINKDPVIFRWQYKMDELI